MLQVCKNDENTTKIKSEREYSKANYINVFSGFSCFQLFGILFDPLFEKVFFLTVMVSSK